MQLLGHKFPDSNFCANGRRRSTVTVAQGNVVAVCIYLERINCICRLSISNTYFCSTAFIINGPGVDGQNSPIKDFSLAAGSASVINQ